MESVEHLRHFVSLQLHVHSLFGIYRKMYFKHFELDKENLQVLALKLSCASNSLYRELVSVEDDSTVLKTQTMSDVHNIINMMKPLVCWLDRAPFVGDKDYIETKVQLLELGFEMAYSAHRGIFSDKPICTIRKICEKITKLADHIIQVTRVIFSFSVTYLST